MLLFLLTAGLLAQAPAPLYAPPPLSACPRGQSFSKKVTGRNVVLSCTRGRKEVRTQWWDRAPDGGNYLSNEQQFDDGGLESWTGFDLEGRRRDFAIQERVDGGIIQRTQEFLENGALMAEGHVPNGRGSAISPFGSLDDPETQWWPDGCLASRREGTDIRFLPHSLCRPVSPATDAGPGAQAVVFLDPPASRWLRMIPDGGPVTLGDPPGALALSSDKASMKLCFAGTAVCQQLVGKEGLGLAWSPNRQVVLVSSGTEVLVFDAARRTVRKVGDEAMAAELLASDGKGSPCPTAGAWGIRLADGSTLCSDGNEHRRQRGEHVSSCKVSREGNLLVPHFPGFSPRAFQLTPKDAVLCAETFKGLTFPVAGLAPMADAQPR